MFRYVVLVLTLAVGLPMLAAGDDIEEDSSHLGVRAQFDLTTSIRETKMVHWGPGTSIGLAYYVPFGKITYFNVRLMFLYNTFRYEGDLGTKYNPQRFDGWLKMIGLRAPLNIGVKLYESAKVRFSLYSGPQLYGNFSFNADYTHSYTRPARKEKKHEKIWNSGMEIGWTLGAAVDYKKHWHAYVESTIGLTDMGKTASIRPPAFSQFRRAEVAVGVGYNF